MRQKLSAIKTQGVSGAVLKWIAIVAMLIDHIGAAILERLYIERGYRWGSGFFSFEFNAALRVVGRLAFPIFCFLLVEGLTHTRNRWKYLLRLLVFALISEAPFDQAFFQSWWTLEHQNVFFTLAVGLSACAAWDWIDKAEESTEHYLLLSLVKLFVVGAATLGAKWIHSDYGGMGVALILAMYLFRYEPWARDFLGIGVLGLMVLTGTSHWIEILAAFSFPLFHLYNGQRGRQPKYFFYVFYPAHLLLLCGLRMLLQ